MTETTARVSRGRASCPQCGAGVFTGANKCWCCGRRLVALNTNTVLRSQPRTYSLSTLFLWMTLASVLLGIGAAAPGLAISLTVLMIPVLIRTCGVTRAKQAQGRIAIATAGEKILVFLASFGVVLLIMTATLTAFFQAVAVLTAGPAIDKPVAILAAVGGCLPAVVALGTAFWFFLDAAALQTVMTWAAIPFAQLFAYWIACAVAKAAGTNGGAASTIGGSVAAVLGIFLVVLASSKRMTHRRESCSFATTRS